MNLDRNAKVVLKIKGNECHMEFAGDIAAIMPLLNSAVIEMFSREPFCKNPAEENVENFKELTLLGLRMKEEMGG